MKRYILFLLAALISLSGCSTLSSGDGESAEFFAMDTVMTVRVWGAAEGTAASMQALARDAEVRLSATDPGSEISHLNANGSGVVSEETALLLRKALELCADTDGSLDISVYPIVKSWGFTTGEHRVPPDGELSVLLENVDYTRIQLDGNTVTLAPGMEIDLGSVAKGRTGDMMADALRQAGVMSALLDLGGNIQTVGSRPDGSPWRIAIKDPGGSGTLGVLETSDAAVVTSGGYERYFTGDDGTVYWHIMDPSTGSPARSGLISVTVTAGDGMLCDAMSTALFVMGKEKAVDYWRSRGDFDMILVTADSEVFYTAPLMERFTPGAVDKYTYRVIDDD
ncbi:MAG: FAD:protein FMN transferase [Oscillospiraceae bacterium]|nr:FAD:protein FMN transferase [Oscillospiraceae bacterium]